MPRKREKGSSRRTGQGSVYERKDGRWGWGITYGYNENGNPMRYQGIKATQAEAVKALNKVITRLNLGVPVEQEKQTVGEFLDFWLAEAVMGKKTPKTCRFYEQMVRLYLKPDLGRFQLSALSPQHIQSFVNRRVQAERKGIRAGPDGKAVEVTLPPLTGRSVRHIHSVLRSALNTSWKWGRIPENPALKVILPKVEDKDAVYLSSEEARQLIRVSSKHNLGNLIAFAINTGLRLGEATGLAWDDVDLEGKFAQIRHQLQRVNGKFVRVALKTKSSRRKLPLTKDALEALRDQQARQLLDRATSGVEAFNPLGLCFTTPVGRPLDPKTVDTNLKALAEKAEIGKKISFHKLRHTAGTHLAAMGVPLNVIKEILGHSQIAVTANLYAHAVPAAHRAAFDALEQAYRTEGQS